MKYSLIRLPHLMFGLFLIACLSGCAHGSRTTAVQTLEDQLTSLASTVQTDEAQRAASCAYDATQKLAHEYRVVWPPFFQNFLVHLGLKERGLCYHWAEDLTARLEALNLTTLELHWGIARHQTQREHNSVVITAVDQPFEEGLVLDPWRHSGKLVWMPVSEDRYPWVEGWRLPPP